MRLIFYANKTKSERNKWVIVVLTAVSSETWLFSAKQTQLKTKKKRKKKKEEYFVVIDFKQNAKIIL